MFLDHLDCNFGTQVCKWDGLDKWKWFHPSYNPIKIDGPSAENGNKMNTLIILHTFNICYFSL